MSAVAASPDPPPTSPYFPAYLSPAQTGLFTPHLRHSAALPFPRPPHRSQSAHAAILILALLYSAFSLIVLKQRYLNALLLDLTLPAAKTQTRSSLFLALRVFALRNLDLLAFVLAAGLGGPVQLGLATAAQAEVGQFFCVLSLGCLLAKKTELRGGVFSLGCLSLLPLLVSLTLLDLFGRAVLVVLPVATFCVFAVLHHFWQPIATCTLQCLQIEYDPSDDQLATEDSLSLATQTEELATLSAPLSPQTRRRAARGEEGGRVESRLMHMLRRGVRAVVAAERERRRELREERDRTIEEHATSGGVFYYRRSSSEMMPSMNDLRGDRDRDTERDRGEVVGVGDTTHLHHHGQSTTLAHQKKSFTLSEDRDDGDHPPLRLAMSTRDLSLSWLPSKRTIVETEGVEEVDLSYLRERDYNPLGFPGVWRDWPAWVVQFPMHLVYFFLFPSILDPPSRSKTVQMAVMLGLCTVVLAGVMAVVEDSLVDSFGVKPHVLGVLNAAVFDWK